MPFIIASVNLFGNPFLYNFTDSLSLFMLPNDFVMSKDMILFVALLTNIFLINLIISLVEQFFICALSSFC